MGRRDKKHEHLAKMNEARARKLREQKELETEIEQEVTARGHRVLFYPKFHCELNFIEYFWGAAKLYARENCDYSLPGLRKVIPQALNSVSKRTIWRFYKKCQRTMDLYRDGITYGTSEFKDRIAKVRKSHRRIDTERRMVEEGGAAE